VSKIGKYSGLPSDQKKIFIEVNYFYYTVHAVLETSVYLDHTFFGKA